jgi:hypothetical protein
MLTHPAFLFGIYIVEADTNQANISRLRMATSIS